MRIIAVACLSAITGFIAAPSATFAMSVDDELKRLVSTKDVVADLHPPGPKHDPTLRCIHIVNADIGGCINAGSVTNALFFRDCAIIARYSR